MAVDVDKHMIHICNGMQLHASIRPMPYHTAPYAMPYRSMHMP